MNNGVSMRSRISGHFPVGILSWGVVIRGQPYVDAGRKRVRELDIACAAEPLTHSLRGI